MLPAQLGRFFSAYGTFLSRHRLAFLIGPVFLCLILASGWFRFRMENDIRYLFTVTSSDIQYDRKNVARFFRLDSADTKYVLIFAKNDEDSPTGKNPNVFATENARQIQKSLHILENEVYAEFGGKKYRYFNDLVRYDVPTYRVNRLISGLMASYADERSVLRSQAVRMTYPVGEILRRQIYFPFTFGGVKTKPKSDLIESAKGMVLYLVVDESNATMKQISANFEKSLWAYARNKSAHSLIDISIYTWTQMLEEVRKNTIYTLKYVPAEFALTLCFAILACSSLTMSISCHVHASLGLLSVLMSFLSGMGLMFHLGLAYNDLVSVTSFIALAIGVDDTFVMLSGWRRHMHLADPTERLKVMLREAGCSITFTSLTDVLAFGVGIFMDVPALRNFCVFTAVAIFCDLIFQITFFPAAMLYVDEIKPKLDQISIDLMEKYVPKKQLKSWPLSTVLADKVTATQNRKSLTAKVCYSIVSRPLGRALLIIFTLICTTVATYGTTQYKADSSFTKVMVDDSEFYDYAVKFEKLFWGEGTLFVFIANAPDFSDTQSVSRFMQFVDNLENLKHSVGPRSTQLWVRGFLDYAKSWRFGQHEYNRELANYLNGQEDEILHMRYRDFHDPHLNRTIRVPDRFYFFTGYHGSSDWEIRKEVVDGISGVKRAYPELNVYFYHEMVECVDLMAYTGRTLNQTLGVVLLITIFLTALFLPVFDLENLVPIILMGTSFIGINATVIGALQFWNVDIDLVMMVCLLMSVGFSVDYTVHMAFTYARQPVEHGESSLQRVETALEEVARPILHSGLSTMIAVCLVSLVQSYMLRTFIKTILLVVLFGLIQSLLVLPAALVLLDNRGRHMKHRKRVDCSNKQ